MLLGLVDAAANLIGLEDRVRAHLEGRLEVLATELLVPFDVDFVDQRPFGDAVRQHPLVVLLRQLRFDIVEEAHPVERADIVVDGFLVEARAGLGTDLNPNGFFFDALVTGDDDAVEPWTAWAASRSAPRAANGEAAPGPSPTGSSPHPSPPPRLNGAYA